MLLNIKIYILFIIIVIIIICIIYPFYFLSRSIFSSAWWKVNMDIA